MTHSRYLYLLLVISAAFSGCVSSGLTPTSTEAKTLTPSPMPTSTPTPSPTQTATLTPPATLEPVQAKATITTWLQKPVDCAAPCFWGITPGQTTLGKAKNIFTHLGLHIKSTTLGNKEFYGIRYDFDSGLSILVTLTVQNEVVRNLRVDITPETYHAGIPRGWLAYSPETLINRYGLPSKVDFFVGRGAPAASYAMGLYFETVDLIIEYGDRNNFTPTASLLVCPLTDRFDSVTIWLGKDPEDPPLKGVPLEKAASLTMEGFSKLMTGDPAKACFNLKEELFP